jgi:hypothetical protein
MLLFLDRPWQFWFEWTITALLILGVALTSFNIYPLNLWVLLLSNVGWMAQAVIWRKSSLFVVQMVVTFIYVAGVVNIFL